MSVPNRSHSPQSASVVRRGPGAGSAATASSPSESTLGASRVVLAAGSCGSASASRAEATERRNRTVRERERSMEVGAGEGRPQATCSRAIGRGARGAADPAPSIRPEAGRSPTTRAPLPRGKHGGDPRQGGGPSGSRVDRSEGQTVPGAERPRGPADSGFDGPRAQWTQGSMDPGLIGPRAHWTQGSLDSAGRRRRSVGAVRGRRGRLSATRPLQPCRRTAPGCPSASGAPGGSSSARARRSAAPPPGCGRCSC